MEVIFIPSSPEFARATLPMVSPSESLTKLKLVPTGEILTVGAAFYFIEPSIRSEKISFLGSLQYMRTLSRTSPKSCCLES
jgi:hypothetical protein